MAFKPPKSYKDPKFINSRDARPLRILAEYIGPESRFRKSRVKDTVVFFGSARTPDRETAGQRLEEARAHARANPGPQAQREVALAEKRVELSGYYEDARILARRITEWSIALNPANPPYLISSGGGPGIMEAANRGASEAEGGQSIGLNISLPMEQYPNPYISDHLNFEFHYFFTRKFWFLNLARALVVFPGGFGTMDELFETLTLIQTKKLSRKLPVVIYGESFWRKIVNFEALVEELVISEEDLALFKFCNTPDEAFDFLTGKLLATKKR